MLLLTLRRHCSIEARASEGRMCINCSINTLPYRQQREQTRVHSNHNEQTRDLITALHTHTAQTAFGDTGTISE